MENLYVYQNEVLKEKNRHISEGTELYYRLLDETTTKFISELEAIGKKCLDSQENPDALLDAVTKAIINMNHVCEQFEQGVNYDKGRVSCKEGIKRDSRRDVKTLFKNTTRENLAEKT